MSAIFHRIRTHKSIAAVIVAAVYGIIASALTAIALFGDNDGGVWFFMDWIYWPASVVVGWVRELVKYFVPSHILHELPSPSFSTLNIFDASCCVIVGTLWYYLAVKSLSFIVVNASLRRRRTGVREGVRAKY